MCGIAGISAAAPTYDVEERLRRMARAMSHRGPDDAHASRCEGRFGVMGLAATRLAIRDSSNRGRQPMTSPRTQSCVVFNGELYNARELRDELSQRGYGFRGHSDTEVVLAAWDEWAEGAVGRFRGMFALGIWDAVSGDVVIARDRLGIKPLYVGRGDETLVFASELRAILASGVIAPRLAAGGLRSFLRFGHVEEPRTMIEGVEMLPAATLARWDGRRLVNRTYWSLEETFEPVAEPPDRATVVRELRDLLEDAVRRHLVSDVPLGVFLSGGIDSSSLVALVSGVEEVPPRTVSVTFAERSYSEEPYMRAVRTRFATDHTEVKLSSGELQAELPAALGAMDQPTVDGINTFVVSKAARGAGLTVVLSGLGGDELFAGYDTFRNTARLEALRRRLPRPAGSVAAAAARWKYGDTDRGRKLSSWLDGSRPEASAYLLQRELFGDSELQTLVPLTRGEGVVPAPVTVAGLSRDPINRVSFLELTHYMKNMLLRDSDVMSMANSLELRVPFLDHVLVERVAALPGRLKIDGGTPKPLLVDAVADLLPEEVVRRQKMGFTFPLEEWLRGSLRQEVEARLTDREYDREFGGMITSAAVSDVWEDFCAKRTSWSRPWALFALKCWVARHVGQPAAASSRET